MHWGSSLQSFSNVAATIISALDVISNVIPDGCVSYSMGISRCVLHELHFPGSVTVALLVVVSVVIVVSVSVSIVIVIVIVVASIGSSSSLASASPWVVASATHDGNAFGSP